MLPMYVLLWSVDEPELTAIIIIVEMLRNWITYESL